MHGRSIPARFALSLWPFAVLLTSGCSTIFPNPLSTTSGDKQLLLPEARAIRDAVPQPVPVPRELTKAVLPAYIVEPGDVLLVVPVELESPVRLPSDQTVLPDGRIDLGRYGRLQVAGKTVDEIEGMVTAAVKAKTPDAGAINVRLISRQSKVYYVLGQVNAPGALPLQGRETVLDGIVAAGGLNIRASRNNIILSRPTPPDGCRVVLPVCYRQIVQLGDTTTNYQLQPGDRVYVPGQGFWEQLCGDRDEKRGCGPCHRPQVGCPWGCGVGTAGVPGPTYEVTTPPLVPPPPARATEVTDLPQPH
jgi:polysaccharide biosynthesis/export protein